MPQTKTRTTRLLVRLTEAEHERVREAAEERGHPMSRVLRDAFASQVVADSRLPVIATLVAVEQVRLVIEEFFPGGEQSARALRGAALDAALAWLDELTEELGARQ